MAVFLKEFIEILTRGEDLPTLPRVVLDVRAALENELVNDGEVAAIIEKDPPLASRLLRLANSAAFIRGVPIGEVRGAVKVLGMRQINTLCLALSVVDTFSRGSGALGLKPFWEHSAAVARTAQDLNLVLNCSPLPREELYVAGLLHDVGLLILDQYFPERLRETADRTMGGSEQLWQAENDLLGTDHGEIGAMLLGRWSLPESISSTVAAHHHPETSPEPYRDAAWLVHLSERICGGIGPRIEIEGLDATGSRALIETLREEDYDIDSLVQNLTDSETAPTDLLV